jgi:hypothetical protein
MNSWTVALVGLDFVPGITRTSVITCPFRSRPRRLASVARRNPMYSLG